jgi:hypothetical protein
MSHVKYVTAGNHGNEGNQGNHGNQSDFQFESHRQMDRQAWPALCALF